MMKVVLVLLVAFVCFSQAEVLNDKVKNFRDNFRNSTQQLGGKLKDVTTALGDVAKDSLKRLGSQALQAIFGAFVESFKGFDLGKAIFGKRDLVDLSEAKHFIQGLGEEMHSVLEEIFKRTYSRFAKVIERLGLAKSAEEVHAEVSNIADEHQVAVRSVIGDTLNTVIDGLRKLYYKGKEIWDGTKDMLLGGRIAKTADPVMVGRRGMLADAWNHVADKLESVKQKYMPKIAKVTEVAGSISAALKHHTGLMFEQAKVHAADKVKQTLGYLSDELHKQLQKARNAYEDIKGDVAESIHSLYQ